MEIAAPLSSDAGQMVSQFATNFASQFATQFATQVTKQLSEQIGNQLANMANQLVNRPPQSGMVFHNPYLASTQNFQNNWPSTVC